MHEIIVTLLTYTITPQIFEKKYDPWSTLVLCSKAYYEYVLETPY